MVIGRSTEKGENHKNWQGVGWVLNPLLAAVLWPGHQAANVLLLLTSNSHKNHTATTNTTFLPASALEPWEYQTCATPNPIHFILLFMDVGEKWSKADITPCDAYWRIFYSKKSCILANNHSKWWKCWSTYKSLLWFFARMLHCLVTKNDAAQILLVSACFVLNFPIFWRV